jgi:hypothetical protein
MKHATGIGRLAGLAVGLGVGAALAATPGVASADDFQISIDGIDLFPTAGNTATATSGMGDIAIAFGNGAYADASGGLFDSAFADGTGSAAGAGTGSFDTAIANGTDSGALASGDIVTDSSGTHTYLGNDDFAYALGSHTIAESGVLFTKTASSDDIAAVIDPSGTAGSTAYAGEGNFDFAAAFGDMLHADATEFNFLVDILPSL